jgi:hypothetical protein
MNYSGKLRSQQPQLARVVYSLKAILHIFRHQQKHDGERNVESVRTAEGRDLCGFLYLHLLLSLHVC